ncbi:MAG TPA: acyl-CoA dehydrogenase family protein [Smithellaceae bacterium]|nr:acyl-CoA dehydrogenase family protein [Smithella sp.]HNT91997.1 acyl-CoA dehydrogenase family protein [Smithellaceae bacterium]HNV65456.1 acyl-CoA dehydrogenase family protein [Smithellaceae bacterium]HPG53644.1 acyl-CoA dehydrogenase family protein [Smithellaceae bacterium]HPM70392.1 acyl-CoA dehydrogenase family protein [Smithellaceae bacterium]
MDFQLSEEQKMFKQSVHDFADQRLAPLVQDWDEKDEAMDRNILSQYLDMGLLGITLPEKYGGAGLTTFDAILAIEELARVSPIAALPVFETSVGPIRVIDLFGTEEQKKRFIPPACTGEKLMSVAMTEPEAGSALTDLTTRAVLKGDHYVVNGQKRFISGGGHSDSYMVYVRLSEQKGAKGIGGIVIEKDSPGFTFGKQEVFMGLHGMPSCDLIFEDCIVPKENLIIPEGGFIFLMQAFDVERCGNATMSLGIAWGALEAAKKYAQERKAFGKPICEFQGVQFLLADMAMKVEAARLLIYRAAVNAGSGHPSVFESSVAKCFANEIGKEVTDMAIQVFGGYGYSKEYPIERMLRDSRGWPVAGGTVQIQRINIAGAMLGRRFSQR